MNDQNQNTNTTPQSSVPPVAPEPSEITSQTPQPTPPVAKISPKESIQIRVKEIKHALGVDDPAKRRKMLIIAGVILGLLLILLVAYTLIPKRVVNPNATLAPSPEATLMPQGEPSEYADDPEVLRIMDEIGAFAETENATKLREDDLRLPTLDWNVNY